MSQKIQDVAEQHDCAIITDRHGDVALLQRAYDDDGNAVVRYGPDPGDHYPPSWWEAASPEQVADAIC